MDYELKNSLQWGIIKPMLYSDFAVYYDESAKLKIDQQVATMIERFDTYISEISKAEVMERTSPKYFRLTELLHNFNTQLQDCKELFLIRMMTR